MRMILPAIQQLEKRYGCSILISKETGKGIQQPEGPDLDIPSFVWVAYSSSWPYLPIAVADSARELARLCETGTNNIESLWSKYRTGRAKTSRYQKVYVGLV